MKQYLITAAIAAVIMTAAWRIPTLQKIILGS